MTHYEIYWRKSISDRSLTPNRICFLAFSKFNTSGLSELSGNFAYTKTTPLNQNYREIGDEVGKGINS